MTAELETVVWQGEPPKPLWKKLTGIVWWWWLNDQEPWPPADQYVGYPQWLRWFLWNFIRNPAFNLFRYVLGFEDKTFIVTGPKPVLVTTAWEATGSPGSKWSVITYRGLRFRFWSYESADWIFYIGWLPSGGRLSCKINRKKSPIQIA